MDSDKYVNLCHLKFWSCFSKSFSFSLINELDKPYFNMALMWASADLSLHAVYIKTLHSPSEEYWPNHTFVCRYMCIHRQPQILFSVCIVYFNIMPATSRCMKYLQQEIRIHDSLYPFYSLNLNKIRMNW